MDASFYLRNSNIMFNYKQFNRYQHFKKTLPKSRRVRHTVRKRNAAGKARSLFGKRTS